MKNQLAISFLRTIKNAFHSKIKVVYLKVNKITRVLIHKSAAMICNLLKQLLLTLITAA